MLNRWQRKVISVWALGVGAVVGFSCVGKFAGLEVWTAFGHGAITNAEWGRPAAVAALPLPEGTNAPDGVQTAGQTVLATNPTASPTTFFDVLWNTPGKSYQN